MRAPICALKLLVRPAADPCPGVPTLRQVAEVRALVRDPGSVPNGLFPADSRLKLLAGDARCFRFGHSLLARPSHLRSSL